MFPPPAPPAGFKKRSEEFAARCVEYFLVPRSTVLFVTCEQEQFIARTAAEAELIWRKRKLWYVLTVRSDVFDAFHKLKKLPLSTVADL